MPETLNISGFQQYFKDHPVFTTDDIKIFYNKGTTGVKDTTVNWRVYALVQQGVIERISRGLFRLGVAKPYRPALSRSLKTLYHKVQSAFPYASCCIWDTAWLNEFTQHQFSHSFIVLELERDACEPAFHQLQAIRKSVFLKPSSQVMEQYVTNEPRPVIIKPLISQAPVMETDKIYIPTLEKILVDLYCDTDIFYAFQGLELQHIWQNARHQYTLQEDKLLRYAGRRKQQPAITHWLSQL